MSDYKNEAYFRVTLLEIEKEALEALKNMSDRLDSIDEALWSIRESLERLCRLVWSK